MKVIKALIAVVAVGVAVVLAVQLFYRHFYYKRRYITLYDYRGL